MKEANLKRLSTAILRIRHSGKDKTMETGKAIDGCQGLFEVGREGAVEG